MGAFSGSLLNNLFAAATGQQFSSDIFNIAASSNTQPDQLLNNLLTSETLEKFNLTVNNNNVNSTNTNNDSSSAANANTSNDFTSNGEAISQELIKLITSGRPTSESMLKMVQLKIFLNKKIYL